MAGLTRFTAFQLWLLVLYRVNTGSCQVKVNAFIGDSVLLSCIYSEDNPLPKTFSVYWTDKDDSTLLHVKDNVPDLSTQSNKFRGRVSSFPELYNKGNFSIVVTPVQSADSGPYECHIPVVDLEQHVSLAVSGNHVKAAATPPPSGGAAITPASLHCTLLFLPLSLLVTSFQWAASRT